jgi:hypothetical protein
MKFGTGSFTKMCRHIPILGAAVAQAIYYLTEGWTIGVRSPTGTEHSSSSSCVQTGSGAHPASYPMGTGGSFRGGKVRPGRDADHSLPSSAEVKDEEGLCLPPPPKRLHGVQRDSLPAHSDFSWSVINEHFKWKATWVSAHGSDWVQNPQPVT